MYKAPNVHAMTNEIFGIVERSPNERLYFPLGGK
jgi:hypothetical protein